MQNHDEFQGDILLIQGLYSPYRTVSKKGPRAGLCKESYRNNNGVGVQSHKRQQVEPVQSLRDHYTGSDLYLE